MGGSLPARRVNFERYRVSTRSILHVLPLRAVAHEPRGDGFDPLLLFVAGGATPTL
jgi:hypothetical protein